MKKRLLWLALIYAVIVLLFIWLTPKKIVWVDYFQQDKLKPYGSHILYNELGSIFDDVETAESSLYTLSYDSLSAEKANYLFVTSYFSVSENELSNLLKFVENGNTVFISANSIMEDLLDTLNITTNYRYFRFNDLVPGDDLMVNLVNNPDSIYTFAKQNNLLTLEVKYDSITSPLTLSEAIDENEWDNDTLNNGILVAQNFGAGTFYIHTLPYAFTNYYMLHSNNHQYASGILSYLPNQKTFWDEYYKPVSRRSQPMLSVFLATPAFKWAFILGVSLLFSYIIFQVKRKQRIIPIVRPHENRSLEFTRTIGDLYFHTQDNADLVQKMEHHFKEYIKEKYYIYNYSGSESDTEKLVAKSGRTIELISSINTLFKNLKTVQNDQSKILLLSQKLHLFYYGRT